MDSMLGLIMILFSIIALETLLIIFVFIKTPAGTFLKAGIFKQHILYIMNKDKMAKFVTFKSRDGAALAGKDGIFGLTENSATMEIISKCSVYVAFRDLGLTLDPMYPAIVQELREAGHKLENIQDITKLIEDVKRGVKENYPVKVQTYKTYKLHDLTNMFPFNTDPTFLDATVQSEISQGMKMMKAAPMVMGGVVTLLVVASVSVYIMRQAFQGTIAVTECQAMVESAKCMITSGTQMIVNSTVI